MADRRKRNVDWYVADERGHTHHNEECRLAVLMDIRDELQSLNRTVQCPNFQSIPVVLREIRKNTTKSRPRSLWPRLRAWFR